jgi:hypothetical protein
MASMKTRCNTLLVFSQLPDSVGTQQGRKVFTLQTLPAVEEDDRYAQVAKEAGFSLHAGVAAQAWERDKLERLCRYISRPALSEKRLSLKSAGYIRYQLKTPYSDGTTHVIFEPLDFISKLASLVPKPKVNLTWYARIIHDTHPLRGPSKAVQIHSGCCVTVFLRPTASTQ